MITLTRAIAEAEPFRIHAGFPLRNGRGQLAGQVILPGTRYGLTVSFPAMTIDDAAALETDLELAKSEGLRIAVPLMGRPQGAPGAPVVDGSGAAGTALPLRGLTPGHVIKKGYWLNVIDAAGVRCLHRAAAASVADGSGEAVLTLATPLRTVLADGDEVLLAKPTIEGVVTSDVRFPRPGNRIVSGLSFTLEESD